jgi:hypothetical protein
MDSSKIIVEIEAEIKRLEEARKLLRGSAPATAKQTSSGAKRVSRVVKRKMSPEGRAKIAAAMKRRWSLAKKSKAKGGGTEDGGYGFAKRERI